MRRWKRSPTIHLAAEAAEAFVASAAFFALAAAAIPLRDELVLILILGALYLYVVLAAARRLGPLYGVPLAIAAGLALDSFYIPPTREFGGADWQNWLVIAIYLLLGTLIGAFGARSQRRTDSSDRARGLLADQQAALRRVATLVARGELPDAVFAAVAEEVGLLLDVDGARVVRYLGDDQIMQLEGWTAPGHEGLPGGPLKLDGTSMAGEVLRTGSTIRIEDYQRVKGGAPSFVRQLGIRSGAAAPIVVDGHLWGAMLAWSLDPRELPEDAETRLAGFTELVATAISNTASREELARLADEQAALRRVATLVAGDAPPPEVFTAVAREVGQLLEVDATHIARYEPGGTALGIGSWSPDGSHVSTGTRVPLDGTSLTGRVLETGRPARMDDYRDASGRIASMAQELGIRSSVGTPIVVDGRPWGVMIASSNEPQALPADTESRMGAFTELAATAISNTEARLEVARLAEEQAALRRVATLVARQAPPTEVFAQVAEEVGLLLGADTALMQGYDADGTTPVYASWGELATALPVGTRPDTGEEGIAAQVRRTGRPARVDDYEAALDVLPAKIQKLGVRSAVGSPIVVDGRLWGVMGAATFGEDPLPADAESRVAEFTELVATAISNTQARSDLAASRARIVAATDEERRRVVRDLHDGAQQRLVHTVVTLKLADRALENQGEGVPALVTEALQHAEEATAELRELAHGILPSVLTRGGLRAGVDALASRMPVPVELAVSVDRLPPAVEATAYFVVAEALTNVAKHSHAQHAAVTALVEDGTLEVRVRDDGVGGAQPDGSGFLGLGDRLAVLEGRLRVESPPQGGTVVAAAIPFR
jgi:signal transduction histidine kinase